MNYSQLALQKRMKKLRRGRKMFREGSKTQELCFLLIEKGIEGYLTDKEIKSKICQDLLLIQNPYERQFKIATRIRSLIRDIRYKFGIWIGHVWVSQEEDFCWKVLCSKNDFNQIIKKVQERIDHLETLKLDLQNCRDNPEYERKVKDFYEKTF